MAAAAILFAVGSCQAPLPSPCRLLTVEEIETAVGSQFGPPNGDFVLESGGLECDWIAESPRILPVWLYVHQFRSSEWDAIRAIDGARSVPGLGEEAYFVPGPGEDTDFDPFGVDPLRAGLHVRQSGVHLTLLHRGTGPEDDVQQVVVDLARFAVAGLGVPITPPPEAPPGFP
jgi:hypothetical protein